MIASLCNKLCSEKITILIGERLGYGADGEVFSIRNNNNQVIKFCIMYDREGENLDSKYTNTSEIIKSLIINPINVYAKVFEYKYLGSFHRKFICPLGKQEFILYYYTMEKLNKISDDERKVFHSILSHEDRNILKKYSINKIKEMLFGMQKGLDFDLEKIIIFYKQIKKSPILHMDLHPRNIMKDADNNFKLIDLDRLQKKEV
jgi:serine/threonine protein kinase